MKGSQEKILGQKVNVKFFTVDPYTPCNRVSRPFLIWAENYILVVSSKGEIKYG